MKISVDKLEKTIQEIDKLSEKVNKLCDQSYTQLLGDAEFDLILAQEGFDQAADAVHSDPELAVEWDEHCAEILAYYKKELRPHL